MSTLTLSEVAREAPAVLPPRRAAGPEKLIDTSKFLDTVKTKYGAVPVFTIQGSKHADAEHTSARDGRHIVAATSPDGLSFVLLNSHVKDRRAHIGIGLAIGEKFLIGPSTPIQRWRGYEEPLEELAAKTDDLLAVAKAFRTNKPNEDTALHVAKAASRHAYLAGVEARPSAKGLLEGFKPGQTYYDLGFTIIGNMLKGNIESSKKGGRRVKRVQRPDGIFHASMMVFAIMLTTLQDRRRLSSKIDFGNVADRAVRP